MSFWATSLQLSEPFEDYVEGWLVHWKRSVSQHGKVLIKGFGQSDIYYWSLELFIREQWLTVAVSAMVVLFSFHPIKKEV